MVICRQSHHCQRTDPQCHHLWSSGVVGCWSGVPDNEGEVKGMEWCSKEAWDWRFMNRQIGHILPVKGNADTFSPTSFNVIDFLCKKPAKKLHWWFSTVNGAIVSFVANLMINNKAVRSSKFSSCKAKLAYQLSVTLWDWSCTTLIMFLCITNQE